MFMGFHTYFSLTEIVMFQTDLYILMTPTSSKNKMILKGINTKYNEDYKERTFPKNITY